MKVLLIKKKISEVTMESRGYYVWKLLKVYLLSGIIYLLVRNLGGEDHSFSLMIAMFPFGVQFFNSVVSFNLFGNSYSVFVFWMIKIILSILIGIIACPITTIYYFVKIVRAQK